MLLEPRVVEVQAHVATGDGGQLVVRVRDGISRRAVDIRRRLVQFECAVLDGARGESVVDAEDDVGLGFAGGQRMVDASAPASPDLIT